MELNRLKFQCQFPGCNHSYLRSEHLNRHNLIHKKAGFLCYLCQRRFTRNDLLHAHLRRHDKRTRAAEDGTKISSTIKRITAPHSSKSPLSKASPDRTPPPALPLHSTREDRNAESLDYAQGMTNVGTVNESNIHSLPLQLQQQQSFLNAEPDDYSWLFREASLFDLPPDDYLHLHFGGGLGTTPPDANNQSIMQNTPTQSFGYLGFAVADYERLANEFPDITVSVLNDPSKILNALSLALDYCNVYMPLFHRSTLVLPSYHPLLLLALCGLGAFLSGTPGAYESAKMIQKHVWQQSVQKALVSSRVELWILQTMVVVGHLSTYALTRQEHEMAEIAHGIIVTLARRNNLLAETYRSENISRQSIEEKWKEWAHRESVIRLAYTIFVDDVQSSIHFTHPAALSVGMMKLPLPSCPALWEATTASEWESQMRQTKRLSRSRFYSLEVSVESLLSMRDPDHKREFLQRFNSSNPLALYILIHGIAASVGDFKYRSIASSSTPATRILKIADFEEALTQWRFCFEKMSDSDKGSRLSWSALVMYHFTAVLLTNNISDIQMAAGSAFSFGRDVTPQRAQAAYTRLVTSQPVSHDTYLHGLEIVRLCLQDVDVVSPKSGVGGSSLQPRPLWQTYTAFLGILVLWTYTLALEELGRSRVSSATSLLQPRYSRGLSICGPETFENDSTAETLATMVDRELGYSEFDMLEVKTIRNDVNRLINTVEERLADSPWAISHEARRILKSLGERDGSLNSHY